MIYKVSAYVYGHNPRLCKVGYEIKVICVPPQEGHLDLGEVDGYDPIATYTNIQHGYSRHMLEVTVSTEEVGEGFGLTAMRIVTSLGKALRADSREGRIEESYADATLTTHRIRPNFTTVEPKWLEMPSEREREDPNWAGPVTYKPSFSTIHGDKRIKDDR